MKRHIQILLAEHDAPARRELSHLLVKAGYDTIEAADGHAAWRLAQKHNPDLMLLGFSLPDADSPDLCRRLRAERSLATSTIVLLTRDQASSDQIVEGIEAGADAFIPWPITDRELLARLRAALRSKQVGAALQEDSLRDQNDFLEDVFESLTHPFYVIDASDYTVKMANSAAYAGDLPDSVTCYALTHARQMPCGGQDHVCPLEKVKRTGKPAVVEHVHQDAEGNRRFFEVHGYPIFDDEGNVDRIIEYTLDITERVIANQALQESEERFRIALENSGIVVYQQDKDLRYTWIYNPQLGYTPEGILGKTDAELLVPEDAAYLDEVKRKVLKTGVGVQETVRTIIDGEPYFYNLTVEPLREEKGDLIGITGASMDITERRSAQETLTKERDFISAVLETAGALVAVLDRQAQIVRFNRACEALTGYTFAEVEGRPFWELFLLPEEVEPVMAVFSELRAGHFPNTFENYWVTRDGERRLISWSNTALLDGEGVVEYIVGTGIDITDHRRAEEALRKSEQEYRQLIEIAQEGVWVIDADAYTTFVNPRMAEMLGYTVEEMQGRHLFSFMDERGVEIATRNLERRRQGISEQHDFEFLCKDRARIYTSLETTPMFDDEGNYIGGLALVADITERRRAEDALRQARDELEMRVQERTAALEDANLALQGEIAERKQIEAELRSSEGRLEQRVRERTRELSTLLEISRNVALTLELEPLLELVLDRLKEIVDYDDATISRLTGEEASTLVHRGEVPSEVMLEQTYSLLDAPFVRDLVMNQETVIIPDVRDDSPLAQDFRRATGERITTLYRDVRSWMAVPLAVKDQVVGLLTLKHAIPDYYGAEKHDLVLAFANQAAVAIENTRLYERAQSLAALEERQRLARDLHDAVSQTLFSASLAAEVLPRLWESNPEEGRRCLTELGQLTRGALAEMRTLLLELRPASLTEVSLEDLLRQLVEAASARARVPMELYLQGECSLTPQVQVTLYRIAQETLSNIVKHANAKRVEIRLRCTPDPAPQVEMVLQDDGRGFELDSVPADGMGLSIMRERAESIGAEINIDSQAGAGTRVELTWPAG